MNYMEDVTILITTFERPKYLKNCLKSIRRFYPLVKIMVVDDSRGAEKDRMGLFRKLIKWDISVVNVFYLTMPFDSGLSAKRNEGLYWIKTKYVVLCDDDFEFTEETVLENFRTILEEDKKLGLVAGDLIYGDQIRVFANRLKVNKEEKSYEIISIPNPEWMEAKGIKYHYADYVFNFFMMRNVPELRWDSEFKIAIEHIDFSLRVKMEGKWRIGHTQQVVAKHNNSMPSKKYRAYRRRFQWWPRFYEKTGFSHGVNKTEFKVFDFRNARLIQYPEYVVKLLEAKAKR